MHGDLAAAIGHYHDLLTADLAAATHEQLERGLRHRGLLFGGRLMSTALRPRLLTADQYAFLQRRSRILLGAFARASAAALTDKTFRGQFRLADWEESLLGPDPGFCCPYPTSRLDAFFADHALFFTEFNTETPAAAAYNDALTDVYLGLPAMREFMRRYEVRPLPARHGVCHALLDAFEQWRGHCERPRIAIVDWPEVPTFSEFPLYRQAFEALGMDCVIADPRQLEYRAGKLLAGDFHVTLVYKRVLISELIERGGMEGALVRAVGDGAVCMVNPFRCKILYKKASFAVLTDEQNSELFTGEQKEAIAAHIPWTRVVEERKTLHAGTSIDLIPWVMAHRERLVLKPNDEYGGKGIVLGWLVEQGAWERAVQGALAAPTVVQERIPTPSEPYPTFDGNSALMAERILDTDPFVCYGEYVEGCLTRISSEALVNVTAGAGSAVPTFVVQERV